jgi:type III pantothenate kinase
MLLAVDIGNTNIKFGVYNGDLLLAKLSIPTIRDITPEALAKVVGAKLPAGVKSALVSSVVPEVNAAIWNFIQVHYGVVAVFVENTFNLGLKINYQPIEDVGADRLINAFSAVEKYGAPCIVCSFGTALTIDVVDANRTLIGGLIAPGMDTLSAALKTTTSKLPEVAIEKPATVIQNTTVGSIQSGIVYGYFGLVTELLTRVKAEVGGEPKIIATGGFAKLIAENTEQIDVINYNLLLDGLRLLHQRRQPA